MANVSRVNGFRPVKHIDGSPFNGQVNRYVTSASDATPIFNGDVVKLAATTDTPNQVPNGGSPVGGTQGCAKWVPGTDTGPILGVAVGFQINPLNLNSPQYRLASTQIYVLVVDAQDVVYEVQTTAAANPTDLNLNAAIADAGGSTVTGWSGETVGSFATTNTLPIKLLGASQKVDNDITSVNYKVLCMLNYQPYTGTQVVGV
jgi:hypothetical protein